jgi:hypothetical protein
MPNPQPEGSGCDFEACSPRQVGKCLRNPPYPSRDSRRLAAMLRSVWLGYQWHAPLLPWSMQSFLCSLTDTFEKVVPLGSKWKLYYQNLKLCMVSIQA